MSKAVAYILPLLLLQLLSIDLSMGYSALEDAQIIAEYKSHMNDTNHAFVARKLVHQASWAAVGSISTNEKIKNYPMVNIISVDDSDLNGSSTGRIHFLLTDLDFTGPDWQHNNKVTFLFTDDENLNCKQRGEDPMEPTCARAIISGRVKKLSTESVDYNDWIEAFKARHPAARNWLKAHNFYLCELQIENIFVLDYYGGPHDITVDDYFNAKPN
ncbi:protein CREG1-like [Eurosta solidaginis]|uniref:protein CREG1-like n=1 Tax=Eurosta solidaginis TaxID=178769 RepID=UPI00353159BF